MRILLVWPIVRYSVWDVARGYRSAFARALGEENVIDFFLDRRVQYHARALSEALRSDTAVLSKYATEMVLAEALYANVDFVFIVSGLNFHPAGLWLLERTHVPTAVLFTESPYEDDFQQKWASASSSLIIMTNDEYSARQYNWTFIPHAFDPAIHFPRDTPKTCDVTLVGSGWPERQRLLEAVDWTGIELKLYGIWPEMTETSPLFSHLTPGNVENGETARLYNETRICLNFHRRSTTAMSMGPRVYELAGCSAFQLSDYRRDLSEIFGDSVPTFSTSTELERLIRHYLTNEPARLQLASEAHTRGASHTFDARTPLILQTLEASTRPRKETV